MCFQRRFEATPTSKRELHDPRRGANGAHGGLCRESAERSMSLTCCSDLRKHAATAETTGKLSSGARGLLRQMQTCQLEARKETAR
eukprot:4418501-Pleurochrysis_carterae.AAC.3